MERLTKVKDWVTKNKKMVVIAALVIFLLLGMTLGHVPDWPGE